MVEGKCNLSLVLILNFYLPITAVGVKGGEDDYFPEKVDTIIHSWDVAWISLSRSIDFCIGDTKTVWSVLFSCKDYMVYRLLTWFRPVLLHTERISFQILVVETLLRCNSLSEVARWRGLSCLRAKFGAWQWWWNQGVHAAWMKILYVYQWVYYRNLTTTWRRSLLIESEANLYKSVSSTIFCFVIFTSRCLACSQRAAAYIEPL